MGVWQGTLLTKALPQPLIIPILDKGRGLKMKEKSQDSVEPRSYRKTKVTRVIVNRSTVYRSK